LNGVYRTLVDNSAGKWIVDMIPKDNSPCYDWDSVRQCSGIEILETHASIYTDLDFQTFPQLLKLTFTASLPIDGDTMTAAFFAKVGQLAAV